MVRSDRFFGKGFEAKTLGRFDDHEENLARHRLWSRKLVVQRGGSAVAWSTSRPRDLAGRQSLHVAVTRVAKGRSAETAGRDVERSGRWVALYPTRGQSAGAKALGAVWDRARGLWRVSRDRVLSGGRTVQRAVARLRGAGQRAAWVRERTGGSVRGPRAAQRHVRYVLRADLDGDARTEEMLRDDEGEIVVVASADAELAARAQELWRSEGSTGLAREVMGWYDRIEETTRRDARLQTRLIVEVPHETGAMGARLMATQIAQALAREGSSVLVAGHQPDVQSGSDPRNLHLHVVATEREVRLGSGGVEVGPALRTLQAGSFPKRARELAVEAANAAIAAENDRRAREGVPLVARGYDARSFEARGIDKQPTEHLGPHRMQMVRRGEVPPAAARAVASEHRYLGMLALERLVEDAKVVSAVVARMPEPVALGLVDRTDQEIEARVADIQSLRSTASAATLTQLAQHAGIAIARPLPLAAARYDFLGGEIARVRDVVRQADDDESLEALHRRVRRRGIPLGLAMHHAIEERQSLQPVVQAVERDLEHVIRAPTRPLGVEMADVVERVTGRAVTDRITGLVTEDARAGAGSVPEAGEERVAGRAVTDRITGLVTEDARGGAGSMPETSHSVPTVSGPPGSQRGTAARVETGSAGDGDGLRRLASEACFVRGVAAMRRSERIALGSAPARADERTIASIDRWLLRYGLVEWAQDSGAFRSVPLGSLDGVLAVPHRRDAGIER